MCVYVCLNFEDNDTKRQARLWNQVSQRELENLWNQVEKKKKKKKKERERERDENERAGELLESSGSKEKEKGEDVLIVYVCGGQNAREKKNEKMKKKREMYG